MFGDKVIYGRYTMSSDKKNRVILPIETDAVEGEKLFVIEENGCIYICDKKPIERLINHLNTKIKNPNHLSERSKNIAKLDKISSSIIKEVKVDNARRVNLNGITNSEKVEFQGVGTMLKIIDSRKSQYVKEESKKMD